MSRTPELRCTYRLQLGEHLDFARARRLVPYLRELGVSHLYLSPVAQARAGSAHGYDVTDPTSVSAELGGEAELRALCEAGLGVVLDVVPNHMAIGEENRYWRDPELRRRYFDVDPESGRHRRFFDIDDLAGVRQEDPEVFAETHRLALRLVREGLVCGLRIDHPDGLSDPAAYLRRLREGGAEHVWVEKILDPEEQLRDWDVEGTVGYEFLNDAAALFVDPAGEAPLTELCAELTGERRPFAEIAAQAKLEQASTTFRPELERLRRVHDLPGLEAALASLPVYRTYVEPWAGRVEDADRAAVAAARGGGMPEAVARALLLEDAAPPELVTRFQQTSPAVTAKGVEDTAFYRHVRLLALNEVGGDPERFGLSVERFHQRCLERARRFPRQLLTTQTHDTKRSGDTRARIGALAEMAEEWRGEVTRWFEMAAPLRRQLPTRGAPGAPRAAPDPTEEYLIYQTLVGTWPLEADRLEAYVLKALREAKRNTSWVDVDAGWEAAVGEFCRRLHDHRELRAAIGRFAERAARAGERAALGQLLLKLTTPGVPDIYQGDELWALSLVDPDNRRPVDWRRRREALDGVLSGAAAERETVKMHLIARALALRARRPEAFSGGYRPLATEGPLCAFLRGEGTVLAATAVRGEWADATIELPREAAGEWRDVLAADPSASTHRGGRRLKLGPRVRMDRICLGEWPVALLERIGVPRACTEGQRAAAASAARRAISAP